MSIVELDSEEKELESDEKSELNIDPEEKENVSSCVITSLYAKKST